VGGIEVDLKMTRGDTKKWNFTATQNGAPLVLDGGTVTFMAKYQHGDADVKAVIRKDNAAVGGVTLTTGTNGGSVKVSFADTQALPSYDVVLFWDLQLTDSLGEKYTLDGGKLTISPDIYRG
jgi:hypothetical protein